MGLVLRDIYTPNEITCNLVIKLVKGSSICMQSKAGLLELF